MTTNWDELVLKRGEQLEKDTHDSFHKSQDQIATEIWNYQRKYGKKWFKRYTRDCLKLAEKENKNERDKLHK